MYPQFYFHLLNSGLQATLIQLFSSGLNRNVHFHMPFLDGPERICGMIDIEQAQEGATNVAEVVSALGGVDR